MPRVAPQARDALPAASLQPRTSVTARAGCYLGLSPVLQEMLEKQPALADAPPGATFFMAGCAAGLTSALLTQPMDTVKTRLQAFLNVEVRAWPASRECCDKRKGGGRCATTGVVATPMLC